MRISSAPGRNGESHDDCSSYPRRHDLECFPPHLVFTVQLRIPDVSANGTRAMRSKDKVAVVLGASAPGGCGWATAVALANEGARVVSAARRTEPIAELARKTNGMAVACDITDPEQVRALAEKAVATFGPIDIAVNAAGGPGIGLITARAKSCKRRWISSTSARSISSKRWLRA
jgi:hypothetical protein